MASLIGILNRFLPFATPGTPVAQDLAHLAAICLLLYYAPRIQEFMQSGRLVHEHEEPAVEQQHASQAEPEQREEQRDVFEDQEPAAVQQDPNVLDGEPVNDDFRAFQQRQDVQAGPAAGPDDAADLPSHRNVGAKKAKSLARKDQRRAYHEFQRAQGEAQRARDAEGAAERETAQAIERERRKAAEAKLEAKKAKEREQKREQERKEREQGIARRQLAIDIAKKELAARRKCNLVEVAQRVGGDADEVWLEKLLNASGILGTHVTDGAMTLTFVTSTGWLVRIAQDDMVNVYELAANGVVGEQDGRIDYEHIGRLLEKTLA